MTATATYTTEGHLTVTAEDSAETYIGAFAADGGEWVAPVDAMLAEAGWLRVGDWDGDDAPVQRLETRTIGGVPITEGRPGDFHEILIHSPDALESLADAFTTLGTPVLRGVIRFRFENWNQCRSCRLQRQLRGSADVVLAPEGGQEYEARLDLVDCHCGQAWA